MTDGILTRGACERGVLARLRHDRSGNTLALGAAGIMALMGMIGGAVDMSRSYMVQSRLQQACDAGALAARKAMSTENLTEANKAIGNRFFDFNFPAGTLGATLISRGYSQPTSSGGTPQAVVNGRIIATVPTTIMRAFGNEGVDLTVTCSSKMEIQSADVAMVLDVTYSMGPTNVGGTLMRVRSGSNTMETRIAALRRAVRAFYNALGPGRAGGDLSKGRVRYAFVPYGTVVNTGHLLTHAQMTDSWNYQSREAVASTVYGWALRSGSSESSVSYDGWSQPSNSHQATLRNAANYTGWTNTSGTGNESLNYFDGSTGSLPRTRSGFNSSTCAGTSNNSYPGSSGGLAMVDVASVSGNSENAYDEAPNYPDATRTRNYEGSRTASVMGWRYAWVSNTCRLQYASGRTSNPNTRFTQTRSGTSTRALTWTAYTAVNYVYGSRTLDVSGLKGSNWNGTMTVPALNRVGTPTAYNNVTVSGSTTPQTVYHGGTVQNATVSWRGCIEERRMINTITNTTPLESIPSGAYDLDVTRLSNASDDDTRWRPWLSEVVYRPNASAPITEEECPAPALKLQEIGDYDTTVFTTDYPNLFRSTSGNPTSYYYPYSTTAANNAQTIKNYIDRIPLAAGTIHDIGFAWGLHLVSGVGMFQSDNPDRFNGQAVSRNIVFMTDGEMNPGEERYVFTGYNNYDGRVAPAGTVDPQMTRAHNRRLRILCEEAKRQGITVWVVAITDGTPQDYNDLRACATSAGTYKSAATSEELIQTFTTIANSIGGLRISQ